MFKFNARIIVTAHHRTLTLILEPKVDVVNQVNVDEPTSQNTGYNYPVPDNPLTLPSRVVTTPKLEPTPTTLQPTTPKPKGKWRISHPYSLTSIITIKYK